MSGGGYSFRGRGGQFRGWGGTVPGVLIAHQNRVFRLRGRLIFQNCTIWGNPPIPEISPLACAGAPFIQIGRSVEIPSILSSCTPPPRKLASRPPGRPIQQIPSILSSRTPHPRILVPRLHERPSLGKIGRSETILSILASLIPHRLPLKSRISPARAP